MKLKDALNLCEGDIVSIVGAGGKTTFMYALADELRYESRVLVTTTTKIYFPEKCCYDFINIGESNATGYCKENGIYLHGKCINEENKIVGFSKDEMDFVIADFDFSLIEADGSKKKPIKGWNETEPVICSGTDKTIGIIGIDTVGKEINDDNVHRLEKFTDITGSCIGEVISINHLCSLIFHPRGLFKDSKGEKVLFVNKVENKRDIVLAYELLMRIKREEKGYIDKIIIGSLKNKQYKVMKL